MFHRILILLSILACPARAGQDSNSNVYPFGQNPNEKRRMYYPDAISVIRNLDKFSTLHIRYHSCAWSPNSVTAFDDDGENYDGEDAWYQGRTGSGSSANAGFSLYGTLKNRMQFGGCRKATYINSFFTTNGADVLIDALGLNVDTSYSYCHEYEWNNNENDNNQDSGDNRDNDDNNNNAYPKSATLGCAADGRFATALFTDEYCQGNYFWNTTTADGTYAAYNKKLKGLHCQKIWNGRAPNSATSNGYKSTAHEILAQSEVCDTRENAACPNPWKRKSRYEKTIQLASSGSRTNMEYRVRRPLVMIFHGLLAVGLVLTLIAYRARNKERLQKSGWLNCLSKDIPKWLHRRARAVRKALSSARKRVRRHRRRKDEYYNDQDAGAAGCGEIIIDDSRDVLDGSPSYEMT